MIYGYTSLATDGTPDDWRDKVLRLALFFIPRANLDNERHYPQVRKWLLEVDAEGCPLREIGLDGEGEPLFGAPNSRNLGFWTDEDKTFSSAELVLSTAEEFEKLWNKINAEPRGAPANVRE